MALNVVQYTGPNREIIVLEADPMDGGPYVPISWLSTLGRQLVQAQTTTAARAILGAAQSGINQDIKQLRGLAESATVTQVVTPGGTVTLANLAAALGFLSGAFVDMTFGSHRPAAASDGVIRGNTDAGAWPLVVPRSLGTGGQTKVIFALKDGASQIPWRIQDDAGTVLPLTLISGGAALAVIVVTGGVVSAYGFSG